MEDNWGLSLWVRNPLSTGMKYYAEFDVTPDGQKGTALGPGNWRSFGLQFQYNYN